MKKQNTTLLIHIIILSVFGFSLKTNAQCIAEAGEDIVMCNSSLPKDSTITFGGSPTSTSVGASYSWYIPGNYQAGNWTYYAFNFLDDTTAANPNFINAFLVSHGPVTFYVSVITATDTCTDSLTVSVVNSNLQVSDVINEATIFKGDSVQLYHGVSGGIPPYNYQWSPIEGLSNPTIDSTWASPDTTTNYTITVTDSSGCSVHDNFFVTVVDTTLNTKVPENNVDLLFPSIYPSPLVNEAIINVQHTDYTGLSVNFYDLTGKRSHQIFIHQENTIISRSEFPAAGLYFYEVIQNQQVIGRGEFLVR